MAACLVRLRCIALSAALFTVCHASATAGQFVCAVKFGAKGEVRYPRFEANDAGEAYCRAEDFAQNPGASTCNPSQHANTKTCIQMTPDPVLERRGAAAASGSAKKSYQCPIPGTQFQEWAPVEAASAEEIVSEMSKQFRNFGRAETCLPAAIYMALVNPASNSSPRAVPATAAGTMSRAEILKVTQDLDALRVQRARNIEQRRDANDTAAVMALLTPVEASLTAEWAALPPDPIARVQQTLTVKSKYQTVFEYLRQQLRAQGPQNARSPVLAMARVLEPGVISQIRTAMTQPAVKEAWVASKLELPTELLPRAQEREWVADRAASSLARAAVQQTGSASIFLTRIDDQQQSKREREQAASWEKWTEPTANEIGLALLRAVSNDGGRVISPSEADRIGPTNILLSATGTAVAYATRIVHVQRLNCTREAEGWSCSVRLWAQNFMRGASQDALKSLSVTFIHRADAAFGSIGIAADQLIGKPVRIKLAASRDGWVAPEFAAAIRADEQKVADQMQRIAEKAQEEQRCEANNIRLYGWDYSGLPCF